MSFLRNYLNKIKPNFEEGGKLHAFRSVFDGFVTNNGFNGLIGYNNQ